ncbi:MAG: peptidylprolyl isomerase [Candidatus Scalinduaceae bacterium]
MRKKVVKLKTLMKVSLSLFLILELVLINGYLSNVNANEKEGTKTIVEKGDKVKVHYTGSLDDGTVFDKSKEGKPLEFTVGSGQMISGFDRAVQGMKLNEEKKVTIKPEDAYGDRNEGLIMKFRRANLPEGFEPKKGMLLQLKGPSGQPIPGTIIDINESDIIVDGNHFLAGKDLTFDIKVVGIE